MLFTVSTNPSTAVFNSITNTVGVAYNQLQQAHKIVWRQIWRNTQFDPSTVWSILGSTASSVLEYAALNEGTLNTAAQINGTPAPTLPGIPGGWTVTPNADGTVSTTFDPNWQTDGSSTNPSTAPSTAPLSFLQTIASWFGLGGQ